MNAQEWEDPWTAMKEKLHVDEVVKVQEDEDDCRYLDGLTPPAQTLTHANDVKFTIYQLLFNKMQENIRAVEKCITIIIDLMFVQGVDSHEVVNLLGILAQPAEKREDRRRRLLRQRLNSYVTVPGTNNRVSKEWLTHTMVQEVLRCGRVDGTQLSKDRISRIKATAARVRAEAECRDEAAVEGERVHLQDDLAFCFVMDNGDKKMWIGKLQQMRSKIGNKSRNLHNSVDLCNPPDDLRLQCQWYHETRRGSGRYKPSVRTTNVDRSFVHISSCLGLIDLEYNNGFYTVTQNEQMERLRRIMDTIH